MVILRRRLVGDVSAQFEARRTEFDQVEYLRCRFGQQDQAEQVKQAAAGAGEFWQLVDRRVIVPEFAVSRRRDLETAQADRLFAAAPGELLGPFDGPGSFDLIRVLGVRAAQLDRATRQELEHLLLEDWLARARATARVEWNWGDAQG
jgi:parvulin-like peptidyl-prolyl isomerase